MSVNETTLVQICLVACVVPSHYVNHCWQSFDWTIRNKLQWQLEKNTSHSKKWIWKCHLHNSGFFCVDLIVFFQQGCTPKTQISSNWINHLCFTLVLLDQFSYDWISNCLCSAATSYIFLTKRTTSHYFLGKCHAFWVILDNNILINRKYVFNKRQWLDLQVRYVCLRYIYKVAY